MAPRVDREGHVYGRLTILERMKERSGHDALWRCQCQCGRIVHIATTNFTSGRTRSCGCLNSEKSAERKRTHGQTGTRTHRIWMGAKARCEFPTKGHWERYGGRGIVMSPEWKHSFAAFLRDMGPCPDGHELDRIDNNGPYARGNCRWVTHRVNMSNTMKTRRIEYNGVAMSIIDWAAKVGVTSSCLYERLQHGWTIERAFTTPQGMSTKGIPKPRRH